MVYVYHIVGYFEGFLFFGYFEETFCENQFLGASFLWKYIATINNRMLACTHVIQLSLYRGHIS